MKRLAQLRQLALRTPIELDRYGLLSADMALLLCQRVGCQVGGSDDGLVGSAGVGGKIQGGVDFLLPWFGSTGFSDMHDPSIAALQGGGDPDLACQGIADRLPGIVDGLGFELEAYCMDGVIGEHADEQMAFDAAFDLMVDGPEAEIGFQRAEDRLQIGQH